MDVILKKYFWVVNLLVLGTCAAFAGRAASHFIEATYLAGDDATQVIRRRPPMMGQPPQQKLHSKETTEIVKRDIFCSGCAPPPPAIEDGAKPVTPQAQLDTPQKSSLQLELVSTMICPEDDFWSMAIIKDLAGKEKDSAMFNRGKSIFETKAVVDKVVPKRVYFRNQGQLEYLELEGSDKPAPSAPAVAAPAAPVDQSMGDIDKGVNCSGNNCTVDRALVEKLLQNTTMLATSARFVPSIKDGKPNGFKLYAIRPNSIFGKIGLQNGDTIKAINGNDMTTPDAALALYSKLRSASHLSVSVERRGENQTMDYTIK
jgi:general secretion pathway protein C